DSARYDYNSLAQKVFTLLKQDFPRVRVRGVPDAWHADKDTGEMVMENTTVEELKMTDSAGGPTYYPREVTALLKKLRKHQEELEKMFSDDGRETDEDDGEVVEEGDESGLAKRLVEAAAQSAEGGRLVEQYKKKAALVKALEKKIEELQPMTKIDVRNWTRTF